jgi:hypothetical protein
MEQASQRMNVDVTRTKDGEKRVRITVECRAYALGATKFSEKVTPEQAREIAALILIAAERAETGFSPEVSKGRA